MELNNVKAQVKELKDVTNKGFATLMYSYTRVVTSEGLDHLLDEALESEEQGEPVRFHFDENYFSVALEYYDVDINNNSIKERFGHWGYAYLYMDELGRGLVIECY